MKDTKSLIVALLLLSLLLSGCGLSAAAPAAEARQQSVVSAQAPAEAVSLVPLVSSVAQSKAERVSGAPFWAKFEGDKVEGSGEVVDGVYRFTAAKTDGEAWHVKLESNYPTVAGRDYRITYRFRSDVAGKVKFGDFQEYTIQKGDNSVTGILTAAGGTSYLDLQLGMLPPFTIDFSEIEVEEYADEVEYENALPAPINFEKERTVFEKHDQGYAPIPTRSSEDVNLYYFSVPWDPGVWKSRLYIKTGMTPEKGVHYRVTADIESDQDMPFEVLFNSDEEEKGYGALYGLNLSAGEKKTCEAVISGRGDGGELVLQFSLGEAPEDANIKVSNVNVEKVIDQYKSVLPAGFALDKVISTGRTLYHSVPKSYTGLPLDFSYTGVDSVFEGHDDDYVVSLKESASSATLQIEKAPAADRGVWKVRLYAATGLVLEPGTTYRIHYDLRAAGNQAEYEACFDGSSENAYGALYGRSLTAGGTDSVDYTITPDRSAGPLTLRLQLGKTDSTAGNTFTLSNLRVETLTSEATDLGGISYGTGANVWEAHDNGVEQTVSASGSEASLSLSAGQDGSGGVWSSRLYIDTGVVPEAGENYRVTATLTSDKEMDFEICYNNGGAEKGYDALYGQHLAAGAAAQISKDFFVAQDAETRNLILQLQLGNSPAPNSIRVSDIKVCKLSYETTPVENGSYEPVTLGTLTASEAHDEGYQQTLQDLSLTISAVPTADNGIWCSKLFAGTGTALTAGEKYKVTANLTSVKAMPFEICFNNGSWEKGYGALYGQSIGANETKDYVCELEVPAGTDTDQLVLQFMLGKTPANNTFTVNSVSVERFVSQSTQVIDVPAGYQELSLSGLSAREEHDNGYTQSLSGMALTVSAIPKPDTGVWCSKLFLNTGTALTAGEKYKVTANVKSDKAMPFEICYNNGGAEKGYGALYGQSLAAGTAGNYSCEFEVAAEASTENLVLQLMLGKSPAGNTVAVNSVSVEKWNAAQESYEAVTIAGLSASEAHDEGFVQSVSGSSLQITDVPKYDNGVWCSKLFVDTGTAPAAGGKYKVTANVSSAMAMPFEICCNNGSAEKGYGALYGQSIAAGGSGSYSCEFEVPAEASANNLILQFQLGKTPEGNTFTVNSVKLEKWVEAHQKTVTTEASMETVPISALSFTEAHDQGYELTLSGSALTVTQIPVLDNGVWQSKLFLDTDTALELGRKYKVTANLTSDEAMPFEICYNSGSTEKGYGALYGQSIAAGETKDYVGEFEVAADGNTGKLVLQFMLGKSPAPNAFTVNSVSLSALKTEEVTVVEGENLMTASLCAWAPINFWAHEDYAAELSGTDSSATLNIKQAPADGREPWKVKLFAETGFSLSAGKSYRISADVAADPGVDYEICCNDGAVEKGVGAKYGLHADGRAKTVSFEASPENDASLILQFSLGNAASGTRVTISNVKVEELTYGKGKSVLPDFRYDSVGYLSPAADGGYLVSLDQHKSSADFHIHQAPSERHPWNVKLNVKTGFTPKANTGYRVSFDIDAERDQNLFEVFYDGSKEAAYGALYRQRLGDSRQTVSYIIMPGGSFGELSIQIRLGQTDGTEGNSYTISNVKIDEVAFSTTSAPETKEACLLRTEAGYSSQLEKTRDRASVRIDKTPAAGLEAWKTKLFVNTGVTLKAGQKYRVSMDVKSIIPAPFEICFNNGNVEKGLGAMFGLMSTPAGLPIEYVTYPKQDTQLVIQLSLGNCPAPNSIILNSLKVEKAGTINLVSDTIYTF